MPKRQIIDIGLPKLDDEIIANIAELAEQSIRNFLVSKIGKENIYDLDVTVYVEYENTLDVIIELDLSISPLYHDLKDVLENEAMEYAFSKVEKLLRAITNDKQDDKGNSKEGKKLS
ncbi:MAG: DUF3194 domain-containing protein [Candidatus Asgardarchaeia archaeon]